MSWKCAWFRHGLEGLQAPDSVGPARKSHPEGFACGGKGGRGPWRWPRAERWPLEVARGREVAPGGGPGPRGGPWKWPEAEVPKVLKCLASAQFLTPFW